MENLSAERAILGAILVNNDAIYQCDDLKPDDFTFSSHRIVFARMQGLAMKGEPVDIVTLATSLSNFGQLKMVGGEAFLSDLVDGVPDNGHVESYVREVADLSRRRKLVSTAEAAVAQANDRSETTQDCVSVLLDRMLELAGNDGHGSIHVKDYSWDVYNRVRKVAATPLSDRPIGLTTSIPSLDRITTGFQPGELIIVASWTGEGKTVLLTQTIVANAQEGIPILWFTQEMSREQVMKRMIPYLSGGVVKGRWLRDPRRMQEFPSVMKAFNDTQAVIDSWPLWVHDAASLDVNKLFAHAMLMVKRYNVQMICVDYIQLIKGQGDSRYDRVTYVSEQLRQLAKRAQVPVLAVSQMARPENREKRQPRMFDLKESGNLENDAHLILMPYRPQDKEGHYTGEDMIVIGKQREGPTGVVPVRFDALTLTFQPRSDGRDPITQEEMFDGSRL